MTQTPPENLARFLDMLGEREAVGLYGWGVLDATLRSHPGHWFPLEEMTTAQYRQVERRLTSLDGYPFRHHVRRVGDGRLAMVEVAVVEDAGGKPAPVYDTEVAAWEKDPERHFSTTDADERAAQMDEARTQAAWNALGDDERDDLPVQDGHL